MKLCKDLYSVGGDCMLALICFLLSMFNGFGIIVTFPVPVQKNVSSQSAAILLTTDEYTNYLSFISTLQLFNNDMLRINSFPYS